MAKTKNLVPTAIVTLSTTTIVEDRLERLVYTGYYGKNAAEAAERIVSQTLNSLEDQGKIPVRPAATP